MPTIEAIKRRQQELGDEVKAKLADFEAKKISYAEFTAFMDRAQAEADDIDGRLRGHTRAKAFRYDQLGEVMSTKSGGRGSAPSFALPDAELKNMYHAAMSSQSYTVSTKDFNSSVTPQLPAELAPWITRAVHEKRLLERFPVQAVSAPSFEIIQHTGTTGAAAPTAEGAVKPEITLTMTHVTLPMIKIACHGAISWEIYSGDYDRFTSYFMLEMPLQVADVENRELLYGTGTGHFSGFFNTTGIEHHDVGHATDVTALDAVESSIEQLRSGPALAEPDLLVISPSSWSALRRIKDLYGRYYLSPDPSKEEVNSLWGVETVVTTACNPGDALLVDTTKFGRALVREGLVTRLGTNADDFARNLLRWVVELRGNLAVERPSAVLALSNLPVSTLPGS